MFDTRSLNSRIVEQEFVVEWLFNAPHVLMFEVFTKAEHLKCW